MDLDIDMDDANHESLMEESSHNNADDILQTNEPEELGEVVDDADGTTTEESNTIVPNKIYVRGVDTLNTDDIRSYAKSHYSLPKHVEWIDDTSANLIFPGEAEAREAIIALSAIPIDDPTALAIGEELAGKPIEGKPEITLHIRYAVQSDKKVAGAALRSRFYLLNPEYDPEERRRRDRYRDRDGDRRRSDRYGGRRGSEDEDNTPFDASLYDDVPRTSTRERRSSRERRHSHSPDQKSFARENRGKELFAGHRRGRDRSASPRRDTDGDEGMDEDRAGSARNRVNARSIKDRIRANDRSNRSKELFPTKNSGRGGQLDQLESAIGSAHLKEEDRPKIVDVPSPAPGSFNIRGVASALGQDNGFSIKGTANAKELFPSKLGGSNAGKELLDGKGKRGPRQRAEDLFG